MEHSRGLRPYGLHPRLLSTCTYGARSSLYCYFRHPILIRHLPSHLRRFLVPCWVKEWGLPVFFCLHWDVAPSTSRRKSLVYEKKSSFKSMECTFQSIVQPFKSIERAFESLEWRIYGASLAFSAHSVQKGTVRGKEFDRHCLMIASCSSAGAVCLERRAILGESETFLYFCALNNK